MRTLKRNENIIVGLAVLIVLIISIVIVGIHVNDKIHAVEVTPCPNCDDGTLEKYYTIGYDGTHIPTVKCSTCGYVSQGSITQCSGTTTYEPYGDTSHRAKFKCSVCGYTVYTEEECTGGDHSNGGLCTICGQQYETHTADTTYYSKCMENDNQHKYYYNCTAENCDEEFETDWEDHTYNKDVGDGACTVCGRPHADHTYSNGTCTTCGYEHTPHTYSNGTCTVCGYEHTQHTYYNGICTACGYKHTPHTYSNGICTVCGYKHTPHTYSNGTCTVCEYAHTNHTYENGTCTVCEYAHTAHTYLGGTCTTCGLAHTDHTGGEHADGKCTVCGLTYTTTIHALVKTIVPYTESSHREKITCSDCNYVTYGAVAECIVVYKSNYDGTCSGVCSICSQVLVGPQTHNWDWQTGKCSRCGTAYGGGGGGNPTSCSHTYVTKNDETNHWEECSKCNEIKENSTEAHTGATHENEGKCTVCDYQYEKHEPSSTLKEYKQTETGHTPVYTCSYSGCTGTHDGTTEAHTGATHANEGKCTVCDYAYEKHIDTKIPKEYIKTETDHTPMNVCSHSSCTETFRGTTEAHKGATHANGGVCTVCRYQYENHGQSTTVKEYIKTETGHTPVYTCSYSGCTETYNGTTENHKLGQYTDNKNGTHSATCSICNYKLTAEHNYQNQICSECGAKESSGNETCEHSYVVKSNKTNHWEECSKCGEVRTGTLNVHTYGTYTDNKNGTHSATCSICNYKLTAEHNYQNQICTECGAKESSGNETCEHSYVVKSNKENHWEECSKCGEVRTGTLNLHTYGTYTDNKNGTHSATCSICNYKLTAEHNYQNQICTECGAKESSGNETCEHSYVVKSNKENHWEECSKCGQIKTGTLEEHTFTNYVDNKDGTHTATCSKCGYKLTEEHQTDGNCPDCGNNSEQKPGEDNNNQNNNNQNNNNQNNNNQNNNNQNNNNNSNNNGDKTDNTVVDKDIPYTGVTSIAVLITIFVIGVVGIISAVKMKKYRDM